MPLSRLGDAEALDPGGASFIALLRDDDRILPAVARLSPARAAAELVVSTAPALPRDAASVANWLRDSVAACAGGAYLMNTGSIGGGEGRGREINPTHAAAITEAIGAGSVEWEPDPDFGYETAASVPGIDDSEYYLLCPRLLYGRTERPYEYAEIVERRRRDAADLLAGLHGLDPEISAAAPRPAKRGHEATEDDEA